MNKIFIRATDFTMRKHHVVRKQGYFKVYVALGSTFPVSDSVRYFHSFKNAYRYFRYHISFLGWNYGVLRYVDNFGGPSRVLFAVDREY